MLLIVILNTVLAVMVVSVIVALHTKAILTDRAQHRHLAVRDRRRRVRRPATARAARQPVVSAG